MKKKKIILKWLNNTELNKEELKAFEQLDAFDSYCKISEAAKSFKAPNYDIEENLNDLKKQLPEQSYQTKTSLSIPSILIRVASIFVIGIVTYFAFFNKEDTHISTLANEKTHINLPDSSSVSLNALSSLSFSKDNWVKQRKVSLTGEAFFKVAKGKKFDVFTSSGRVSVLGTQFNVKNRENFFEVTCYEGSVKVTYNKKVTTLTKGNIFSVINNTLHHTQTTTLLPDWQENKSSFKSLPYAYILKEFERQYDVTILTKDINLTTLFTGSFVHYDIETALQSITIPMRLNYTINNKNITLYKE